MSGMIPLVCGSIWGLAEATLGHVLHVVRVPGLPGLIMVPFAVLIMGRAAARSRSAAAVFFSGAVAASFKIFDLLVPGTDILSLVNPIQAILLEALAGAAWVSIQKMGEDVPSVFAGRTASVTGLSSIRKP